MDCRHGPNAETDSRQPPDETAECGVCSGENPAQMVARLAYQKAADVARRIGRGVVIGCDTVVECNGQVLGKPADRDDASDGPSRSVSERPRNRQGQSDVGQACWGLRDHSDGRA